METKQQLIAAKVERLQELQVHLDRIHQEQSTLLNDLVQLTSAVAAYTLSPPTKKCADFQVDSNIGRTEENAASADQIHTTIPSLTQSITTPIKNTQSIQQLQVGDHIYIKNKISHSDRASVAVQQIGLASSLPSPNNRNNKCFLPPTQEWKCGAPP